MPRLIKYFAVIILICHCTVAAMAQVQIGRSQVATGKREADQHIKTCRDYFEKGFFQKDDQRRDSIKRHALLALQMAEHIAYQKAADEAKVFLAFVSSSTRAGVPEAVRLYHEVINRQKASPFYMAFAHSLLGTLYFENLGQPDSARIHVEKAIEGFKRSGDQQYEALNHFSLGMQLYSQNKYPLAIDHLTHSLQYFRLANKKGRSGEWAKMMYIRSLHLLIALYTKGGDVETAKQLIRETERFYAAEGIEATLENFWIAAYTAENRRDSALFYVREQEKKIASTPGGLLETGNALLKLDMYKDALPYLTRAADSFRTRMNKPGYPNARRNLVEALSSKSSAEFELKKFVDAKASANEALEIFPRSRNSYTGIRQAELLATLYTASGNADSAVYFLRRYQSLKDSLLNEEFKTRLSVAKIRSIEELSKAEIDILQKEKELRDQQLVQEALIRSQKEQEILLLAKDNSLKSEILKTADLEKNKKETELAIAKQESQLKEERLKKSEFERKMIYWAAALVILFSIILIRVLTLRRANEKLKREQAEDQLKLERMTSQQKQAEFQQQALQLEMQALRAQMNPHFIFNCLSSINWLILGNHNETASQYLNRFSRLIRMVLQNSGKPMVSLEEELNMLELYINMEQLRFENAFDYVLQKEDELDPSSILIPPLLLQPFCENAIWHGMSHRNGKGKLILKIRDEGDHIVYVIEDNGIGRARSAQLNSSSNGAHHSMGSSITAERIDLLNKTGGYGNVTIEDLTDEQGEPSGTRVIIRIRQISSS